MGIGDESVGLYRGESGDAEDRVQSVLEGDDLDAEEAAPRGVLDPVVDDVDSLSGLCRDYKYGCNHFHNRIGQDETPSHQAGGVVPQAASD